MDVSVDTEDYGGVMLRLSNGVRGVMHVSQVTAGHNEGFPDTFKQLFRSFYTAIEADKTFDTIRFADYPTFEDGHREVLLCEAILKSSQEQRWIELVTNGT